MTDIKSIAFALDTKNVPSFLLDWEVTKLCNLDCSYCPTGVEWGGHDNTTQHPPLEECLRTIDFMYEYVDLYMRYKKPSQRKVILNVYGGESLFHPNIVEILQACRDRHERYRDRWYLTVCCTTNAIVGKNHWQQIVPLIDNFTLSYHSESLPKQKMMFQENALYLKQIQKPFRAVVVMHNHQDHWQDCVDMTQWFQDNNIEFTPKPLDNFDNKWSYSPEQFGTLKTFWINRVPSKQKEQYIESVQDVGTEQANSIDQGRPCCGGRKLSLNGDLASCVTFVPRQGFEGWSCSVNWFFLFVQQLTGLVYTNKDCRVSTTGRVEPLGTLDRADTILNTLKTQLESAQMPIIKCVKKTCVCGFCAPKAADEKEFLELIRRNAPVDIFQKTS